MSKKKSRAQRARARAKQDASAVIVDLPPATIAPVISTRPSADYNATNDKKKRMAPLTVTKSEDKHLDISSRRKLLATARDQERNISLLQWMVNKHLDTVASFNFQATTDDEVYNSELEAFIDEAGHAKNCDVAARHNLASITRLLERRAVVDGDCFLLKVRTGHVQGIEGDRVASSNHIIPQELRTHADGTPRKWVHGLECTTAGRALNAIICKRDNTRMIFDKVVRAFSLIQHGYFKRFDQWRGISPLSTAITTAQDLYETWDYNLIKAKIHALFGVAVTTEEDKGTAGFEVNETVASGTESDDDAGNVTRETIKQIIKPNVTNIIDLDPGDKIDVIESRTPSTQFLDYSELMVKIVLLALDIPWIFFDALKGSYSVHRTVAIQYEQACKPKRKRLRSVLNSWTAWRLGIADMTGQFPLPRGKIISDIKWDWQAAGTPWIDPEKEVKAGLRELAGGINSPQRICKRLGRDYFEIIREIETANAYAAERNVTLNWDVTKDPSKTPNKETNTEDSDKDSDDD